MGGLKSKTRLGQRLLKSHPSQRCTPVIPDTGSTTGGPRSDPISKTAKAKEAGGEALVAERLLSKCEALSTNPSTAKNNFKNKLCQQVD
jgi:hypothetical protein